MGAGFVPDTLNTEVYDSIIKVGNDTAMDMARRVAREEGILAVFHLVLNICCYSKGKGKTVVTVLPSNGERYLSTPLYSFDN